MWRAIRPHVDPAQAAAVIPIHSSQGANYPPAHTGLLLPTSPYAHGQLYVPLSRGGGCGMLVLSELGLHPIPPRGSRAASRREILCGQRFSEGCGLGREAAAEDMKDLDSIRMHPHPLIKYNNHVFSTASPSFYIRSLFSGSLLNLVFVNVNLVALMWLQHLVP